MKLDSFEALAKMHKGLAAHFTKLAEGHTEMSKAHGEHAAFIKGTHDAMADDHEHKAYFGKAAAHHEHMSGLHKAHASAHEAAAASMDDGDGKATKAAGVDPAVPATDPINKGDQTVDIGTFLQKSVTEVMGELGKTADFQGVIKDYVMKAVKEQLGQTIVPTNTKAVGTTFDPTKGPQLVPRAGQELTKEATAEMPAELSDWIPD